HPAFTADVLAQKARDAIQQLGYTDRPADEAYNFAWDNDVVASVQGQHAPPLRWSDVLPGRPSPLLFWYRRSQQPMTGFTFHHDLLTPGIVDRVDPPPIDSAMIQITFDEQGRLISLEAIPPQVEETKAQAGPIDWKPLLTLGGLDESALHAT